MPICRAAAPLALLAALVLASCTTPEPEPTPTRVPTTEPLFATEEEALAAAEEAYSEYQLAVDKILNAGGAEAELIDQFALGEVSEAQKAGFRDASERGLKSIGVTNLDLWTLQSFDGNSGDLSFYVCKDVGGVDVVGLDGKSVVSPDRPDRGAVEVQMVAVDGDLKVAKEAAWAAGLEGC